MPPNNGWILLKDGHADLTLVVRDDHGRLLYAAYKLNNYNFPHMAEVLALDWLQAM